MIRSRIPPQRDVLIVGAGPAGSVTAALLARAGWSVAVLERAHLPRPKPCGECLNPGAMSALRRVGLLDPVLALSPALLHGWEIRSGDIRAVADFPDGVGHGLGLPRDVLDAALVAAARESGTVVEEGVTVRRVSELATDGVRTLTTREPDGSPGARSARVVVGADGLRSVVARSIGAPRRLPKLRKVSLTLRVRGRRDPTDRGVVMIGDGVTVGVAPVDAAATLWNLTLVLDATRARAAAGRSPALVLDSARRAGCDWLEGPEVVAGPWASGPFDWPMRAVTADGIVLVGDAAGYYDPLTGQGIFRAVRSAELAASAIDSALRGGRVSSADFRGYALRHRAAFAAGGLVQHAVEQVVSRGSLRDRVVGSLAQRPSALGALLGVTGDGAPTRSLLRPEVLSAFLLPARGDE
jgi:flavin-dependent dehydrogenase